MNSDFLKDVISAEKTKHDATTALEHEAIILRFQQTGCLDREDAIKKYKEFNDDHPEYYMAMSVATKAAGTAGRATHSAPRCRQGLRRPQRRKYAHTRR